MNGARVPIAVGRLASKKQGVLGWCRKRPHRVHTTYRDIAVGTSGKRVGMPIVRMRANQRALNPATGYPSACASASRACIDNDIAQTGSPNGPLLGHRPTP